VKILVQMCDFLSKFLHFVLINKVSYILSFVTFENVSIHIFLELFVLSMQYDNFGILDYPLANSIVDSHMKLPYPFGLI
jgi:hypothetical protein